MELKDVFLSMDREILRPQGVPACLLVSRPVYDALTEEVRDRNEVLGLEDFALKKVLWYHRIPVYFRDDAGEVYDV